MGRKKNRLLAIKKHIENRRFPYLACVILNTRLYKASKGRRWRMNHTSHTFCLIYLLSKKTFFSLSPVTSLRCLEKLPHFWARRILFFASLLSFSGYTDPSPFRGIHSHLAPKRNLCSKAYINVISCLVALLFSRQAAKRAWPTFPELRAVVFISFLPMPFRTLPFSSSKLKH